MLTAFEQRRSSERSASSAGACSPSWWSAAGRPAWRWRAPSPSSPMWRCATTSATSIRATARIVLVEAGPRVLPAFPQTLSESARARSNGCTSRCASARRCPSATPTASPSATSAWRLRPSSGRPGSRPRRPRDGWAPTRIAPAGSWSGRTSRVPGHPEIFVIGDTAHRRAPTASRCPDWRRWPSSRAPMSRACCGRGSPGEPRAGPFRYRNYGALATIGRRAAVADFGWLKSTARWPGCSGASSTSRS